MLSELDRSHRWRGVTVVAVTYIAFLLYAQFGFLEQVRRELGDPDAVRTVMAAMGVAGLAASLAAGWLLGRTQPLRLVRVALALTGMVALASPACHGVAALSMAAVATGACLGVLTVAVAASLRELVGPTRAGLAAGIGTGAAYFVSNLPPLFAASPGVRAAVPGALCVVATALVPRLRPGHEGPGARAWTGALPGREGGVELARALGTFLVLIALDSAAFSAVQSNPPLHAVTWGGPARQLVQGAAHLTGAIVAGRLLDVGRLAGVLWATWGLFALAFPLLLYGGKLVAAAGPVYALGIAAYSTALVVYPSAGDRPVPRWRAALIYGIAGWLGSALGIGATQGRATVPVGAALAAGLALAALWVITSRPARRVAVRQYGGALSVATLAVGVGALASLAPAGPNDQGTAGDPVASGRAVYVSEGCIHCHSQYVRPVGHDSDWWGPARPLDRTETPPLIGDRRQGPDLREVGARRGPFWNEAHLKDPRLVSPGSRMPSYAHLFRAGEKRGSDLVAYLASLGITDVAARRALVRAEPLGHPPAPPSIVRGHRLFGTWCAACHGLEGGGDGPLAGAIAVPATNLLRGRFDLIPADPEARPAALERLIRHGLPPTPMPGHETLPDQDIADLVAFVDSLAAPQVGR
jgi:cytochrome c oxidase cbb3-type subunit 2